MVNDRLSLKMELLKAAENDVQRFKKLYALVEEEAKLLPAVMDSKEYIQAVVEGAGKIVKEMMESEVAKPKIPELDKCTEATYFGVASESMDKLGVIESEEPVKE